MTGTTLLDRVQAEISADESLTAAAGRLVTAAIEGDDALYHALVADGTTEAFPAHRTGDEARTSFAGKAATAATGVFLSSIAVQGFRGIGPRCTLALTPGPGLTLVVGRNGSGKSSFAEALESLLTGENHRWTGRSAVWKQGWRNLHWMEPVEIETRFTIEGERQPLIVRCAWPAGENDLESASTTVRGARRGDGRAALGWDAALSIYRPFLPYNELGSFADRTPSALFDTMSAALGIDALVVAGTRLRSCRLEREKHAKAVETDCREHRPALDGLDDDRARTCGAAIAAARANAWDLDALELVLDGVIDAGDDGIALLRWLASLQIPDAETVHTAAERLQAGDERANAMAATDAGRADQVAELLARSLALHAAHGDQPCPVCGAGTLDGDWRARTEAMVKRLRRDSKAAVEARQFLKDARLKARALLTPPPAELRRAGEVDIDPGALMTAWKHWSAVSDDMTNPQLIEHLRQAYADLAAAATTLRGQASAELERREDRWRPVARDLRDWLPEAKAAAVGRRALPDLKKAESWLNRATGRIRTERFRPVADRAARVWELLRQNSAVSLDHLELSGHATQRRLALDVSIDGADGKALGVMSQGELHALALSLFLPRALLPQSPFGFVVIDDPVQAMDPGKVDGLARVLDMAARTRQVVVFTHDERLPESIRRLQIHADVVEVTRRAESVVECRKTRDPVKQYLHDARSLIRTDGLPAGAAARAAPLYCRLALEAACTEVVRRRRIGRGEAHAAVAEVLTEARTLLQKLALALFDDAGRAGDVMERINRQWGSWAGDAVARSNRGSHTPVPLRETEDLVAKTESTTRSILALAKPK